MEATGREAEPIAKGVWPALKQNFSDLFKWEQRVELRNEYGEARYEWMRPTPLRNPFSLMAQLTASNWLYFLVGLASWTADAFDFHALSIQTVKLAAYYDRSNTDISTAITLTLLLRSVGAAFFGAAGDRYGRKWPMVINMLVLGLLQIATISPRHSSSSSPSVRCLDFSWAVFTATRLPWPLRMLLSRYVLVLKMREDDS
jgi:MFS family permease